MKIFHDHMELMFSRYIPTLGLQNTLVAEMLIKLFVIMHASV